MICCSCLRVGLSIEYCNSLSASLMLYICFFFFSSRRRHTRFDCDWSSDVCSSDLIGRLTVYVADMDAYLASRKMLTTIWKQRMGPHYPAMALVQVSRLVDAEIGRASCRERV